MSHRQLQQRLGDYLEGDLDLPEREALERHLCQCEACAEELAGLREVRTLLRELPTPEPPPQLLAATFERLRAGSERRSYRSLFGRLADWWGETSAVGWPVPLAAAAMAVVAVTVWRGLPPETAPSPAAVLAHSAAPSPALRPGSSLVLVSENPATAVPAPAERPSRRPSLRIQSTLPPIHTCVESQRAPRDCILLQARMVDLALRDRDAFLAEVEQIPAEHRDGWMQQLFEFARLSGSEPRLASVLRSRPGGVSADR